MPILWLCVYKVPLKEPILRLPIPTEAQEGSNFVAYLRYKRLAFTHIANETGHTPEAFRRAIRVKQQGVSKGFVDYLVIVNNRLIGIELKRLKGSQTSPEQLEWIERLNACGVESRVCKGCDGAIAFVESILKTK